MTKTDFYCEECEITFPAEDMPKHVTCLRVIPDIQFTQLREKIQAAA